MSTAHGSQTATEYRVVVENSWYPEGQVKWFLTEASADAWIANNNPTVLSRGWATKILDF